MVRRNCRRMVNAGKWENDMTNRGKQFLLTLLGVAMLGGAACTTTTTTHRAGPSQAAVSQHGISEGDTVLVRYTNDGDANSSSRSEVLQITRIGDNGITGVDEHGRTSVAAYDEIFQIERRRTDIRMRERKELSARTIAVIEGTGRLLGAVIYAYGTALGGP
jgi:hypothetical protein